jgi:hypothetical protein
MTTTKKKQFRIKVTAYSNVVTYLTRDERGNVSYINGSETPLALSNLVGKEAAELRFALVDAPKPGVALLALNRVLDRLWVNNQAGRPRAALL